MPAATISLATLIAAVRAADATRTWASDRTDAELSEVIRTARTIKGAVWLATRIAGPQAGATPERTAGRWATALACLRALRDEGDETAAAMLATHEAETSRDAEEVEEEAREESGHADALADAISREAQPAA